MIACEMDVRVGGGYRLTFGQLDELRETSPREEDRPNMPAARTYRKLQRPLIWLETFVAIVETGSLDAAASHLGVARSVVSDHLRALEESLTDGAPLLERGPGVRVRLTSRGERVYGAVAAPIRELSPERLRFVAAEAPSLRVGMAPTLAGKLLESVAPHLAARGVKLEATFGDARDLVREIETGQLDLAFGFTPLPPHRAIVVEILLSLPFVVMAPAASALARRHRRRKALRVEQLAGEPFVDWAREDPYGHANAARFAEAGVTVREQARAENYLQLFPVLRAYGAFAIGPSVSMIGPVPDDIVTWRLEEDAPPTVDVVALLPNGKPRKEAQLALDLSRKVLRA